MEELTFRLEVEACHLVEEVYHPEQEAFHQVQGALAVHQVSSLEEEAEEEADAFPLEEEEVVEVAVLQVLRTYHLEGEVVEEASLVQPLVEEEVEEEALKLLPHFGLLPID